MGGRKDVRKEGEKVYSPVGKPPRDVINWISALEMEGGVLRAGAHRVGVTTVISFVLSPRASVVVDVQTSKRDRVAAWMLRHRELNESEIISRNGMTRSKKTIEDARKLLVRGGQIKKDHGIYVWTDRS